MITEQTEKQTKQIKEMHSWDYSDTCVKYDGYDRVTILEPTARNMNHLMQKINELVKEVNRLSEINSRLVG